ncbi:MAG: hypothetical protein Q8O12_03580 [Candidatus Omnitrophota bacterium]|nr:hypothetical protein [Candidatus Omnitrophota bacterium]
MKIAGINKLTVFFAIGFSMATLLSAAYCSEGPDDKEGLVNYIKTVSPIMTDADMTIKNIGFNIVSIDEGARRMADYINRMSLMNYPEILSGQYKMTLLAFKKIRMGLLLFSPERREMCVGLIKSGGKFLRYAAEDILDIVKKEGLLRKEDKPEEKGE